MNIWMWSQVETRSKLSKKKRGRNDVRSREREPENVGSWCKQGRAFHWMEKQRTNKEKGGLGRGAGRRGYWKIETEGKIGWRIAFTFSPGEIIGSLGRYKSFILSHLLAAKSNDGGISGQQGHKTEDSQYKRAASWSEFWCFYKAAK